MIEKQPRGLFAKMAAIMGEIDRLPKDGTNDYHNYRFTTDSAVYDAVRKLMAKHNVAVFASMTSVTQQEVQTKKGTATLTQAQFVFTLACGDTGETQECHWFAEAQDNQDKGINKAATAALKYWLLKTFIISTGEDPDAEGEPATRTTQQQQPQRTTRQQPAPRQSKRKTAPPPADDASYDEHPAPNASRDYHPVSDTALLSSATWGKLNAWLSFEEFGGIKNSQHAVNAMWKALGDSIDSLMETDAKQQALRETVEAADFGRLFKSGLTVADVFGAIEAYYAAKETA